MKKLLCAVLLGALTLTPSFSQSESIARTTTVFLGSRLIDAYYARCFYNVINNKTQKVVRSFTKDVFALGGAKCPVYK